jgi:hypothetical protein
VSAVRALALLLLAGCVDSGSVSPAALDGAAYATSVHPVVEARCATLDCHGDLGRALRLYSEDSLRARDDLRGLPLSDDELAANVRSFAALDAELIVDKPLLGREAHEGGDVWLSADDDEVVCLASWLGGAVDTAACQRASSSK